MDELERRLASVLSADAVGYSRLMAADEDATVRQVTAHREQVEVLVRQHEGRLVDFTGDNFLAEFSTALASVECALEIQRVIRDRNADLPGDQRLEFRIGIHLGDIRIQDGRLFGDGVNIAARLEGLAEPGGLCISGAVHEQVRSRLKLSYRDLGNQQVKNLPQPVRAYRVREGAPSKRKVTWSGIGPPIAAALGVLVAVLVWRVFLLDRPFSVMSPGPIESLAVLPMVNLSGDAEQEYFANGMTEALISGLAKIGELRVISRTSIMQFKGTRASLPEVARKLNVDAIVEGSVLRVGDDVRITAQLIDARTDHHLWSESYAGTMENILALQGRVAQAIAREIERELRPSAEPRRIDPDAHVAYLKGLYYSRQHTADASHKAIEQYRRSINLAPDYSLPYAGMADTFACSPLHAWTIPDSELWPSLPQEIMARARAAAEKALALDETLAEPHTALAIVRWIGELDWSGSEAALMSALDRNPNESFTHLVYAHLLGVLGRMEEAKEENRRASELDPLDVRLVVQRGDLYWQAGETTKAEAQWRKAIQLDPTHHPAQRGLGRALCERGRLEEAAAAFEKARTLSQDDPMVAMELGYCYAKTGRTEDARAVLGWLDQRSAAAYVSPMSRAGLHVGLGDQAETFRWLERAFETRDFNLSYLLLDPRYDPLRSDGRYQSLIRRMGLPQAAVDEIMSDSSVMMNRSCLYRGSSPRAGTCAGASGREG